MINKVNFFKTAGVLAIAGVTKLVKKTNVFSQNLISKSQKAENIKKFVLFANDLSSLVIKHFYTE